MRPSAALLGALLAVASAGGGPRAQPRFPAAEAQALARKKSGHYAEAARAFAALLAESRGGPREAALAEYFATMAVHMARPTGDLGWLATVLDTTRRGELARAQPTLADRLAVLGLQIAVARGDASDVAGRTLELDCIQGWWLLGPLDNERGSGMKRELPPEQRLELEASYAGKKRAVRWRELPLHALPGGQLDLDALVRPNDQVLCYLAVALEVDMDRDVVLHLGSDEAVKVFCNGRELLARDVRRRIALDQDAVTLPLRAGVNLLLVKVGEQEGEFALAARLADPAGGPARGVRVRTEASALAAAARVAPAERSVPPPFLGARTVLQHAVDTAKDPLDAFRLAYLWTSVGPDDPTERRDRALAQLAATGLPHEAAARYLLAFTRAERNLAAEERDDNARRHDLAHVLTLDPDYAQAHLALAQLDLDGLGAAIPAERGLRRALELNPGFVPARVALAEALHALDQRGLAAHELEQAGAGPAPWPQAARQLADLRESRGDVRGAIAALEQALRGDWTPADAVTLAGLRLRAGQRDLAVTELQHAIVLAPTARPAYDRLAALLEAEGAFDQALATWRGWLVLCPEDDQALVELARLHGLLRQADSQRETLRAALDLNPNLKHEQRHLEFLEADAQPFYGGLQIDGDAVLAQDAGPAADAAEQNDPYYWLLRHTVIRAYRNGTTSRYEHTIARVLNDEGARRLATHRVGHWAGEQRARLLDVRVVKKDGREVRPRFQGPGVQLPPLAVGDAVEVRSRVDDIAPTFFGDYFGLQHELSASDGTPCRHSALTLVLEQGRDYRFQTLHGAPEGERSSDADGHLVCRFEMHDLVRRRLEEQRPASVETEPIVRVTTYRDWDHFGAWWHALIRKQSEVSPAMRTKVAELTAALTDERARIAALYRFVTTDVRYTAWEFGVHGYQPYSTPVIFERRHGDCKDKTLLLNALLGEIGVKAYPVLIHADPLRSAEDLTLPMVHHFNHCISWLPPTAARESMFLDGTATYHTIDMVPGMDQGARVLVVSEGKGELHTIPWAPAESNRSVLEAEITLDTGGDAQVALVERPSGDAAVLARDELGNEPSKQREKLERRFGAQLGKVAVRRVECSDLLDVDQPVRVAADLQVASLAARQGEGLLVKGVLEARSLTHLVQAPSRELALLLGTPHSESSLLRYRLPPGFAPVELPGPVELHGRFGSYRMRWTFDGGELRAERERTLTATRVEPPEFEELRELLLQGDQADRRVVVVRKEGSR